MPRQCEVDATQLETALVNLAVNARHAMDGEVMARSAIMGALSLYLDFLNLFTMLLSLMGNRNE